MRRLGRGAARRGSPSRAKRPAHGWEATTARQCVHAGAPAHGPCAPVWGPPSPSPGCRPGVSSHAWHQTGAKRARSPGRTQASMAVAGQCSSALARRFCLSTVLHRSRARRGLQHSAGPPQACTKWSISATSQGVQCLKRPTSRFMQLLLTGIRYQQRRGRAARGRPQRSRVVRRIADALRCAQHRMASASCSSCGASDGAFDANKC